MSASPPESRGYVRRNLAPLLVGVAALLALGVGVFFVVDRVQDDDGEARVSDATSSAPADAADGLSELLDALGGGLLLGVTVTEEDGALLVGAVVPGSPADDAGLEVGDEILEVNGDQVRTADQLRDAVAAVEVDEEYEIRVRRNGDDETLTARRIDATSESLMALLQGFLDRGFDFDGFDFGDLEQFGDGQDGGPFGFRVDPFSGSRLQPRLGIAVVQTNEGLTIMRVEPGSVAANAGLHVGDIIVKVDGQAVETIEDLRAGLPSAVPADEGSLSPMVTVELLVLREGEELSLSAPFPAFLPDRQPPELPLATPTAADLLAERLGGDLDALESFLTSEEFLDGLEARLSARLETVVADAVAAATQAETPSDAPASEPVIAGDLDVYRGTVDLLSDQQIVLGGSLGAISFALTDETAIVGAAPEIGRISTIAANAERDAVLVLTTG